MCGRYAQTKNRRKLKEKFDAESAIAEEEEVDLFRTRFNIAPSQNALVVVGSQDRQFKGMAFGWTPVWLQKGKRLTIARAETIFEKPSFKNAFLQRRCLVVADSFYEWDETKKPKQPIRFSLVSEEPFAFAAIWETTAQGKEAFAIVTTEANELIRPIQDRMPVILPPDKYGEWLDSHSTPDELLALLRPYPAGEMRCYAVNPIVNSVAVDSPQCAEKWEPVQGDLFRNSAG